MGTIPKELINFNSDSDSRIEIELKNEKGIGIDKKTNSINSFSVCFQFLPLVTTNLTRPLIISIGLKTRLDIRCVIRAEIKG